MSSSHIASKELIVIHCWSSPRSRSTALMYAWDSRPDCIGIDEPLYRDWLYERKDRTDIHRPYKNELLYGSNASEPSDEASVKWDREQTSLLSRMDRIVQNCNDPDCDATIIFCKHMGHHRTLFDFDTNMQISDADVHKPMTVTKHVHILLTRDPIAIMNSWKATSSVHLSNDAKPDEVGLLPLLSIYSDLMSRGEAYEPIIVDSDELVKNPSFILEQLCSKLQVPFSDKMLSWSVGPKECDGAWASHWYSEVHQSAGWNNKQDDNFIQKSYKVFDPSLMSQLRLNLPIYRHLKSLSITQQIHKNKMLQEDLEDPRNVTIFCWIGPPKRHGGGQLYPRDMAGISPFDSAVQGGDAVWEGLRIYDGKILTLEEHLTRLFQSSKAMGFENVHTRNEVKDAIFATLGANGMRDDAHIRLTLTRGIKCTSSMNPKFNLYGTTLIVLAEWKPVTGGRTTYDNERGISLITAANRRNPPSTVDSKIHHNNLINNILPKIQANHAGAADAIMLDLDGFVSETNATNIFMVNHEGVLMTPTADSCLPGITRATILRIAKNECDLVVEERRVSLAEFHAAEEVFTTGTMGGLSPVTYIDGRTIGSGTVGPVTKKLQTVYKTLIDRPEWTTTIPPFV